ncbi:uncharacterized protein LOC125804984 [Astyanax mexicanus]|uniref:uncharacterized protein LOC125804984 n=1 Tax=Astyanax mexicanus TaxID=7994 RepID=UPI0020CAFF68|nr:uncharacterized protein LOC125804984 [Astyanax mexicanus]
MSPKRSANITANITVILILLAVFNTVDLTLSPSGHQIPASSGQEGQKGTVDQQVVGHKVSKLTCSPTCSGNCFYSWFRDDHRWIPDHRYTGGGYWQSTPTNLGCSTTATVWIKSTSPSIQDRYSCNISNYIQPPSDCELGEKQWGVTYTPDSVCALEGSSVRLSCSYKYPGGLRVTESFWFINEQHVDLRDDDQYKGRVQYYQTQLYHTVRITDLRASDSQIYKFRFITDDPGGKYIGSSGVSLSVTGSSGLYKTSLFNYERFLQIKLD